MRLWLRIIAYNLGNLWRRLALPKAIGNWSLTSLQQRLVKTGERLVKHARYYWLLLAESHLTRRLFAGMLRPIAALLAPAGQPRAVAASKIERRVDGERGGVSGNRSRVARIAVSVRRSERTDCRRTQARAAGRAFEIALRRSFAV